MVDYIGRRHSLIIAGISLVPICLALIAFTEWDPLPMMLLLGFAYSIGTLYLHPTMNTHSLTLIYLCSPLYNLS